MALKKDLTKIYDAHTHFDDSWYVDEHITVEQMVREAEIAGVGYFNDVAFDLNSSKLAVLQAEPFDNVFAIVGIHPDEIDKHKLQDLETLKQLATNKKVVGIGEVGLDYFHSKGNIPYQKRWFEHFIKLAQEVNLPLMVHIRDDRDNYQAYDDAIEILKEYKLKDVVIHCFSANEEYAKKFIELGYYIEIGGAVTFKNAKLLQQVVKIIPLDSLLVETDAPYLSPHPFRGQINFSKNIVLTVDKIAEIKNISREEVISATTQNAFNVFLNNKEE